MQPSEHVFLYVTCSDGEEAERIARDLVERRMIACANIMAPHKAVYRDGGRIEAGPETGMLLKTRGELTLHVAERIKSIHSYETPCVVALPIQGGSAEFLQWISAQTD